MKQLIFAASLAALGVYAQELPGPYATPQSPYARYSRAESWSSARSGNLKEPRVSIYDFNKSTPEYRWSREGRSVITADPVHPPAFSGSPIGVPLPSLRIHLHEGRDSSSVVVRSIHGIHGAQVLYDEHF